MPQWWHSDVKTILTYAFTESATFLPAVPPLPRFDLYTSYLFHIIICSFVVKYNALRHPAALPIIAIGQMLQTPSVLCAHAHTYTVKPWVDLSSWYPVSWDHLAWLRLLDLVKPVSQKIPWVCWTCFVVWAPGPHLWACSWTLLHIYLFLTDRCSSL